MGSLSSISQGQYLLAAKELQFRDVEVGEPGDDEIEIAPRSTTLCGSDLHYYNHGRNGSITIREPLCLGHEFAGEITAVGSKVKGLRPGDRVAIECGVPCSSCEFCLGRRYNLCSKLRFRGSGAAFPHFQGSLQQRIIHPARWTHHLTFDDGALLEPLAVACHAVQRAQVVPTSTCLVFGAGAVGLLCAAVARSKGCSRIVICDVDQRRIDFAVTQGFAELGWIASRRNATDIEGHLANAILLSDDITSLNWPGGGQVGKFSVTFECTGAPSCVQTSIYATKSGGRVMLVGMGTPNHTLPLSEAGAREVDLMPSWRYAHCYQEAIQLMVQAANGLFKPDIRQIITHHFNGLKTIPEAFDLAGSSQDAKGKLVIKVVINT